jgi:hypothetical protein
MKLFSLAALAFLGFAVAQNSTQNNTASDNNYLGSTPAQRLVVNATQAAAILQAAAYESGNLSIPVNIAVSDPAGLVSHHLHPNTDS